MAGQQVGEGAIAEGFVQGAAAQADDERDTVGGIGFRGVGNT